MTGSHMATANKSDIHFATFDNEEISRMAGAIDAVCAELGIHPGDRARREAIANRVIKSYAAGRRHPLNLVHAALETF